MKGAPEWILVGYVKRIHGNAGEMLISSLSERDRFTGGAELFLSRKRKDERMPVRVASSRMTDRGPLIMLEGINSREAAQELFGASLFIPAAQLEVPADGTYYAFQIEGCEVYEGERHVGTVTRLVEPPKANPYIEIEPADGSNLVLVPFISQAVISVDIDGCRIDVAEGFVV